MKAAGDDDGVAAGPDRAGDYTMGARTFGATDEARQSILDADVSPSDVPASSTCAICLDSLCDESAETEGGGVVRWPSCPPPGHIFHRNCMQELLRADHRCPVCRSEVPHVSHGSRAAGVIPAAADSAALIWLCVLPRWLRRRVSGGLMGQASSWKAG